MSIKMSCATDNIKSPFEIITIDDYDATCEKIPVSSIEKIDIVKCNDPTETLSHFYNRQSKKPDIIINGGLFNMSNGMNILSFVDEGKEQNYKDGFEGFGTTNDNFTNIQYGIDNKGKWKDFMTAYPVLVKDGKNTTTKEWGNATDINYNAARQVVGYDEENFYILTIDARIRFNVVQEIINDIGMQYAFNLDGGGSVRKMRFGDVVNSPSENRPVDSVLCVYLKERDYTKDLPAKFIVDVITTLNVRDTPNGNILGVLYPKDVIIVYGIENGWAKFKYDVGNVEYAYCSMDYLTFIEKYEEPEKEEEIDHSVLYVFEDVEEIDNWALDGMAYCVQKGYMKGSNNKLHPLNNMTREEFCTMIYRILEGDK